MSMGTLRNLAGLLDHPNFRFARVRLPRRARACATRWADCDAIAHMAALQDPALRRGAEDAGTSTSTARTSRSSSAARLGAHVVLASTSDVYGQAEPPFHEDDPIVLGPPTTRRWSYAASKYYDEHLALRMAEEEGLKVTILRFFNAYGVRNHPSWWGGPLSVFFEDLLDGKDDGDPRRRPPDPLVHLRERHGRRRRPRAGASGDLRRGHQHRQRRADRDHRARPQGPGRRWASRARCAPSTSALEEHRRQLPGRPAPRARPREGASACSASSRRSSLEEGLAKTLAWHLELRARGRRGRVSAARRHRSRRGGRGLPSPAPARRRPLRRRADEHRHARLGRARLRLQRAGGARARARRATARSARCGAAMFLLAVLLFRPIEQTVSRAVADHVARGEDARPAVRSAAWLTALITAAAVAGCVLAWAPITDRLFGGEPVLTVALIAGLAGYGALLLRARPRRRRPVVRRLRPRAARRRRDPLRARAPAAHRRLADGGRRGDRRGGRRRRAGAAVLAPARRAARASAARARGGDFALGSAVALRAARGGDRRLPSRCS